MVKEYDPLAVMVGKNIETQRKMLGFTRKYLADKINILEETMRRMEIGQIAPKMSRLSAIAEHLRCSIPYLFRVDDNETNDRAAHMAEVLRFLPPNIQEALVELVVQNAKNTKEIACATNAAYGKAVLS